MNAEEIQFIVDELFIGNNLAAGRIHRPVNYALVKELPQKQKSSAPGLLIGHRHFPWLSSSSVHPRPL